MIDKTEEKKMTEKRMIKKTGLALLGLVIGMAFMGSPSVAGQNQDHHKKTCEAKCEKSKHKGDSNCVENCHKKRQEKRKTR